MSVGGRMSAGERTSLGERMQRLHSRQLPSAPLAAGTLLVGYAVAAGTGSRPLGGVVLAVGGLSCIAIWRRGHGTRTAVALGAFAFSAFVLSHVLALAIGAWPSVLVVSGAMAGVAWRYGD